MKIIEKIGVLATMGLLLIFIIVISSSYAFFKPTIQGNDTAKRITLSSKKIPTHPLYGVLETLAQQGTYAGTYSGASNDTYGVTGTKTIYYIKPATSGVASTLLNKINVKFAGYCWQMLRTTETGGVKLIYNGEYVNGTGCLSHDTNTTHKGIIGTDGTSGKITGNYMYSDTFAYDTTTPGTFTLVSAEVKNWSNASDKEYILGKYTCMEDSTTDTCSTLYYINAKHRTNVNAAWYTSYEIGDTQNAQIGTSPFNANRNSPAYAGYKFGQAYEYVSTTAPTGIMGYDVYWNGANYELKELDGSASTGTSLDDTHHYMCNNGTATCADGKVRYYYNKNESKNYYYYTELESGDKVENAISKMLDNSANTYDSAIKSYLENWYYNKLRTFEDYIDQGAIYCNDRGYTSLGGWAKTESIGNFLYFSNNASLSSLSCSNVKDKFSVNNINAELNYPIGLVTKSELYLISNNAIRKTGQAYWLQSPNYFAGQYVYMNSIRDDTGGLGNASAHNAYGVRPVITLKPSREAITGTGTLADPYVIGENN